MNDPAKPLHTIVKATRYYTFAAQTVAIRTDRGLGNGVTSLVTDHHGTPIAAIPNGGHPAKTAITRLYTDPFGATRGAADDETIPGDTQFLGIIRDGTTGLTLLGARYYDEVVGAFTSVDPILDLADPQQWNAYAYAGNSPISRSDPSGLLALGRTDYEDINGKSFQSKANGTVQASPPKTVVPPVSEASVVAVPLAVGGTAAGSGAGLLTWGQAGPFFWVPMVLMLGGSSTGSGLPDESAAVAEEQSTPATPPEQCPPGDIACALTGVPTRSEQPTRDLSDIERATLDDALRPQKMEHVFDPKHNFDPLVSQFGSREAVMEQFVRNIGQVPTRGTFEVTRTIGGQSVVIRGAVVNGVPRIGTAFIP